MSKTTPPGIKINSSDGSSISISPDLANTFANLLLPADTKVGISTSDDKASALVTKPHHEKA